MNKVISPKAPKPLPEFLSRENLKTLLNDVNFGTGYEAVRNKLIILLFYCTGIRCSELTNLKTGDLDAGNQTIRVMGKRSKERIIPVGKEIIEFYHEYILIRGKFLTEISDIRQPGEEFLFLSNLGKAIYSRMVYRIVHTYLSIVASNNRLSPHVLRHTFATHMLDNGADLNAIKEILGHSSLAATQVYTHNTIEKLKSIHKQAHPRA
jgi:integrase/recombinase XerC